VVNVVAILGWEKEWLVMGCLVGNKGGAIDG